MRYVSIDLSSDNYLQQPQIFGGYAGEHNETVLQVKLPDRMIGIECSGYRFDFQTSEDNEIPSPLIPVSELKDNILSFKLTEQLTVRGKLLFNVVAQLLNGETVDLISKTNMVVLYIADSPEGKSTIADPDGYKDEYIKMINELTFGKSLSLVFDTEAQLKSWVFGHGKNFVDPNKFVTIPTEPFDSPQGYVMVNDAGCVTISSRQDGMHIASNTLRLPSGTFSLYVELSSVGGLSEAKLKIGETSIILDKMNNAEFGIDYMAHTFTIAEETDITLQITCDPTGEIYAYIQIEEGEEYTGFEPFKESYVRPDGKTVADLSVGDALYIIEHGVPDYWWDGETIQPIESKQSDSPNMATQVQIITWGVDD